jgi:hypothetical protein
LLKSVSFPDIKRALIPAVAAAFVNAVSALGQVKKPTLAHKSFSINNIRRAGFLSFCYITVCQVIASETFHSANGKNKKLDSTMQEMHTNSESCYTPEKPNFP